MGRKNKKRKKWKKKSYSWVWNLLQSLIRTNCKGWLPIWGDSDARIITGLQNTFTNSLSCECVPLIHSSIHATTYKLAIIIAPNKRSYFSETWWTVISVGWSQMTTVAHQTTHEAVPMKHLTCLKHFQM